MVLGALDNRLEVDLMVRCDPDWAGLVGFRLPNISMCF